ncbi:hypothetical protein GQ44DRAFT_625669, partial [Phaeosphaeriaceae sp. PMI808]
AYASHFSGRHGGGYIPGAGTFVLTQNYQQQYQNQPLHCGGGNFDPASPFTNPSVITQPAPIAPPALKPQDTFSSQVSSSFLEKYHRKF